MARRGARAPRSERDNNRGFELKARRGAFDHA